MPLHLVAQALLLGAHAMRTGAVGTVVEEGAAFLQRKQCARRMSEGGWPARRHQRSIQTAVSATAAAMP